MFRYIKSFFMSLNANAHPGDIAHAVSLGLLVALVPRGNLLWIFLFIFILFIRVNKGTFFLSLILFSLVVPLLDVPVELAGYSILSLPFLLPWYELLYRTPFIGLTRFYNSMVAGGLAAGIVLYIPVYLLFRVLVVRYRTVLQPKIASSKAAKIFVNLPLIKQILNAPVPGGFKK